MCNCDTDDDCAEGYYCNMDCWCQGTPTWPDWDPAPCFSSSVTVDVFNKGEVAMKDLKVGDKVLVPQGKYETVYAFDHLSPTAEAEFLQFQMSSTDGHPLEVTPSHLVYLQDDPNPVRADSVKVGDYLQKKRKQDTPVKVEKIKKVSHTDGVYSPQTPSGDLIVNGIACSTYSSLEQFLGGMVLPVSQHQAIHVVMAPVRVICMGVSSSFCKIPPGDDRITMESWALKGSKAFQSIGLPFVFVLFLFLVSLPVYLVELIFGPVLAPLAVLSIAATVHWAKQNGLINLTSQAKEWQKKLLGKAV